jgi:hypothetical protein
MTGAPNAQARRTCVDRGLQLEADQAHDSKLNERSPQVVIQLATCSDFKGMWILIVHEINLRT